MKASDVQLASMEPNYQSIRHLDIGTLGQHSMENSQRTSVMVQQCCYKQESTKPDGPRHN